MQKLILIFIFPLLIYGCNNIAANDKPSSLAQVAPPDTTLSFDSKAALINKALDELERQKAKEQQKKAKQKKANKSSKAVAISECEDLPMLDHSNYIITPQ